MSFYRLIYTSHANVALDVKGVIDEAQANNAARSITGGLALMDGAFIQYLEGSKEDVLDLFSRISCDPRHRDVKVLEQRTVPRRMFDEWSMAELEWTDLTKMIFRSFSPGQRLDLYDTDPQTAAPLFRAWAATEDWKPLKP